MNPRTNTYHHSVDLERATGFSRTVMSSALNFIHCLIEPTCALFVPKFCHQWLRTRNMLSGCVYLKVYTAYCVCPAGLAGCCNHIAALLYALEEFVQLGLREESRLPCTSRLQLWNCPRCQRIPPSRVLEVVAINLMATSNATSNMRLLCSLFVHSTPTGDK